MFRFWNHRDYMLLLLARLLLFTSLSMTSVAVGWHVYDITGSALDLGYVGLALFLPEFLLSLVGGDLADRMNRLLLMRMASGVLALTLAVMATLSSQGLLGKTQIFSLLALISTGMALGGPAGAALLPSLVPKEQFSRAVALASSLWQITAIVGPALGGLLYGIHGNANIVYTASACGLGVAVLMLFLMRVPALSPETAMIKSEKNMWQRVREGLAFVRGKPILLGAISLDLFAVLLGGAVALMPIFAREILNVGPAGLGTLRSAPAVGAAVMAIWLAFFPITARAGLKMFWAVLIFGLATCVFGLSKNFSTSLVALVVLGAADMISVVIRHTLVQIKTPHNMRGRVSAVNQVFIGASNELGEFESGLTAHWFGTVPAVVIGGIGTIVVLLIWTKLFRPLFNADKLEESPVVAANHHSEPPV